MDENGLKAWYVVEYENGSGCGEYCSFPQPSLDEAWEASGLKRGESYGGFPTKVVVFWLRDGEVPAWGGQPPS
jgi:hypothetical protein